MTPNSLNSEIGEATLKSVETQNEALAKFRAKAINADHIVEEDDSLGTDDATLLRFLRARNFNLKQSEDLLKRAQHWRKTCCGKGIDQLYEETDPFDYPERDDIFKYWPLYFHKCDKLGRPINIQSFGQLNLKELYKRVPPERHWEAFCVSCELLTREILPACSEAEGKKIATTLCIVDLAGFGLSTFWQFKNIARRCFAISQDCFPETMGSVMVLSAPSAFPAIWNVIKRWLAPATQQKIHILGADYHEKLFEIVDRDSLPKRFGGTCDCAEGCHVSSAGPWMDVRKCKQAEAEAEAEKRAAAKDNDGVSVSDSGVDMHEPRKPTPDTAASRHIPFKDELKTPMDERPRKRSPIPPRPTRQLESVPA